MSECTCAKKRILYYGGSITCGSGASDYENSWARLSFKKISKALYGDNVEMINASISGTGSHIGAFRLSEHVLPYDPDMVIVEFATNDRGAAEKDPQPVISAMDHIVQALKKHNPNIAIVFVYTTNQGKNAASTHGIVARHYGIPEIDLQTPINTMIDSGEKVWTDFLLDTAHPNDYGHAFYAQLVADAILADPERFRAPVKDAPSISPFPMEDPYIRLVDESTQMDGFVLQPVDDPTPIKRLEQLRITRGAVSDRPGDSITFDFEGDHFAVYHRIGATMGRFSVTIDDQWMGDVNCYHRYFNAPEEKGEYVSFFRRVGLGRRKHRAVIRVLEKGDKALTPQVIIAGIFVG